MFCHFHSPATRRRCLATTDDNQPCTGFPLKKENVCAVHIRDAAKFRNVRQIEAEEKQDTAPVEDNLNDPINVLLEITDSKDFAKAVLDTREFREYIIDGLRGRDLPSSVVLRLMDYADGWGKPVEKVEVKDTTPVTELTLDQIRERAAFYTNVISALQDDDEDTPRDAVH